MSEPIVVLYKSATCGHCTTLSSIWEKGPKPGVESVTEALKKVYPKIRFFVVNSPDMSGSFDENMVPKDLRFYAVWFPMVLLVPGRVWDEAMSKLGPMNNVPIRDGVQIFNGSIQDIPLKGLIPVSNIKHKSNPEGFATWLRAALNNDDFKRAQNGLPPRPSEIVKSVAPPPPSQIETKQKEESSNSAEPAFCSIMNIIPWRY